MAEAQSTRENVVDQQNQNNEAMSHLHLESLDRVMKLPVIEAAINQGAGVYEKVKGANSLFNWALSTAEATVHYALVTAAPLVQKLDRPIQMVDQTLVKGLDTIESNVPIVKQEPQQIYETAKTAVTSVVKPTLNRVCSVKASAEKSASSLKELSWNKANEVLATQYGQMAVTGVDSTSALAERLLDYYFPPSEDDENYGDSPISAQEDPVLHTVQTVGRLSNKAARRVYKNVSVQIKSIKPQDVKEYVASLIAVLHLTNYLSLLNQKVQNSPPKAQNGDVNEQSTKESNAPKTTADVNSN